MIRSTLLAGAATFSLLAGCSGSPETATGSGIASEATNDMTVEDVPSDGLSAPADMPLDRESNAGGSVGNSAM